MQIRKKKNIIQGKLHNRSINQPKTYLQSHDSGRLEAEIGLEVLGDLTDQTLEGELADEKLGGFLVATDLAEGDGAGAITMGLLDSAGGRSGFAGSLGGQLLAGRLASGGLAGGLFGAGHCDEEKV